MKYSLELVTFILVYLMHVKALSQLTSVLRPMSGELERIWREASRI
jgi:hypothetical protein